MAVALTCLASISGAPGACESRCPLTQNPNPPATALQMSRDSTAPVGMASDAPALSVPVHILVVYGAWSLEYRMSNVCSSAMASLVRREQSA